MSDLPYINQAQEVKITGQDSTGNTVNFVNADSNGNLSTKDYSDGATGSAVPPVSSQIAGSDGTNLRTLSTDTSGKLKIDINDGSGNAITSDSNGVAANQRLHIATPDTVTSTTALGALNATIQITLSGCKSVGFQINSGTFVGVLAPYCSLDGGVNWKQTVFYDIADGSELASLVFTSVDTYQALGIIPIAGSSHVQVKVITYTSGTANTLLRASQVIESNNITFPDGSLSVTPNPKLIFDDTYATSSTLDTINRWNAPIASGGGVIASVPVGGGDVALATGTTANGYSVLTSQHNFNQLAPGFIELQNAINIEFPIIANTYRYWGFGTPQTVPTATNPIQDGLGFEINTDSKMYAVSYSGGTRNIIADLSTSTGNGFQPADTKVHKYFVFFRGDLAYWKIDTFIVATMLTGAPGPINNTLPIAFTAIAGSTAPSSSGILTVNGTWVGDTTGSSTNISDGKFAWRRATVNSNGSLIVSVDGNSPTGTLSQQLFDDTYSSSPLDTTNRWNTPVFSGGGVAASVPGGGGDVALGTGTTANGYSILTSQYSFQQESPGFLTMMNAVNLEFPITANTYRFWGLGTTPATPTAVAPLTDAVGFEVATSGKMYAITYSGGTRNIIADLSTSTGNSAQPQDNAVHKYFIYFRGDLAYWSIDTPNNIVGTMLTGGPGPINNILPIKMLAIAGSTAPASSGVLTSNALFVGDTSNASIQISDSLYAWRKITVKPSGSSLLSTDNEFVVRSVPVDGTKTTYSASVTGLLTANSATDIFTITGSSTKTIRVTRIEVGGTVGGLGGSTPDLQLIKRSSANSGGTSTTRTAVPHDSNSSAATASVKSYTANPTLGTIVGNFRSNKIDFPNSGQAGGALLFWDFGNRPSQAIVLRGTAETLALNLNAASLNTSSIDISIEWSEE